jgi:hypothetical protein
MPEDSRATCKRSEILNADPILCKYYMKELAFLKTKVLRKYSDMSICFYIQANREITPNKQIRNRETIINNLKQW